MPRRYSDTLVPAYLLHARPYRETSVIADFFTQHHGRVSGVVRGVRGKQSKTKSALQPFSPLLIGWMGKHELVTVTQVESAGCYHRLLGNRLICGMYVNELLLRLLPVWQSYEMLFSDYLSGIAALADTDQSLQGLLRRFELQLLVALGYGVDFTRTANGHEIIFADKYYIYVLGEGFQDLPGNVDVSQSYLGAWLLAMSEHRYDDAAVCKVAKRLTRMLLAQLLGSKPLCCRELLMPV